MRDRIGLTATRWWSHEDADNRATPDVNLCSDCALPLQLAAPAFITSQDRDRAGNDLERLRQLPGAPAYFGPLFWPWQMPSPGIRGGPRRSTSWAGEPSTDQRKPTPPKQRYRASTIP